MRTARLSTAEFIALTAMVSAMVAFAIDAMLPALPGIAAELSPDALNRAQLIVTSFVLGMGVGTLFTGPMSDAWGRKPVVIGGSALYAAGAALAWAAGSLELMLAARVIMGLGAAGPRVAAIAMVRDLYQGREMARIMSFCMTVFALVPAIAPSLGALIIAGAGWRAIFPAFILFALVASLWLGLRQPETLAPNVRRPLRARLLWQGAVTTLSTPVARLSILAQTLSLGMLFTVLSSTQPVFDLTFRRGSEFPLWFMGISACGALGSFVNARAVMRFGTRRMVRIAYAAQVGMVALMILTLLLAVGTGVQFAVYLIWTTSVFVCVSMTLGNLNALLMEPLGHIAGLAASVSTSLATVGAVLIAVPIGQSFNGTPLPIAVGIGLAALTALVVAMRLGRGAADGAAVR